MNDTTKQLIRYYIYRVSALEAALRAAQSERDTALENSNDMINRSANLYH
jgi:hypothetical protein